MIQQFFKQKYGYTPALVTRAPGRINIIGEHTDYNMGLVLPAAIDLYTYVAIGKSQSTVCRIHSVNMEASFSFDIKNIYPTSGWENYIKGVTHAIQANGYETGGFDVIVRSEVPLGFGLSSSAALECSLAWAINELFELGIPKPDIAHIGRQAEHQMVGVKCGILDQYASTMGKQNKAILLDCNTLHHQYIPLALGDYTLVLCNTNVSHTHTDTAYNERQQQCATGVQLLRQKGYKIDSLRDVSRAVLEQNKAIFPPVVYRRCTYVLEENERVLQAAKALVSGDIAKLGTLMYASHEGLQHKYEVSCAELDFLVDIARKQEGVLGSRMMGGGFGGCTINIVHKEAVSAFLHHAAQVYQARFGKKMTSYQLAVADGCSVV